MEEPIKINSETSVQDNKETSVQDNKETSVQDNKETSVQDNKETSVQDNKETSVQDNKETSVQDNKGRTYATGKRKNSIARVWLKRGEGKIIINGKNLTSYFARPVLQMIVNQPMETINSENKYDIKATVNGGGLSGQAGALRHGISKALSLYDITLRPTLKKVGFLTRDPRVVERKKYGLAKARKSYQFSKR